MPVSWSYQRPNSDGFQCKSAPCLWLCGLFGFVDNLIGTWTILPICPWINLSVRLSVFRSVWVDASLCPFAYLSVYLCLGLSVYLSIHLSTHCLSSYRSVYLSVLSVLNISLNLIYRAIYPSMYPFAYLSYIYQMSVQIPNKICYYTDRLVEKSWFFHQKPWTGTYSGFSCILESIDQVFPVFPFLGAVET